MNKYLLELFVTIFFIYVVLATNNNALAVGVALSSIIIIGGEINPLVTLMRVMNGAISINASLPIIVIQIIGAIIAFGLYKRV